MRLHAVMKYTMITSFCFYDTHFMVRFQIFKLFFVSYCWNVEIQKFFCFIVINDISYDNIKFRSFYVLV